MPKLVCAVRSLVAGGVETTALTLHHHLSAQGATEDGPPWRVCLALMESYGDLLAQSRKERGILRPRGGSQTPSQREDLGLILRSAPRLAGYSCRLQALLTRMRPDVLFTHSGVELLAAARPLLKRRSVWVAGVGSDAFRDITSKHPALTGLFRPVLSQLYRGPHRLVTASRGLADALIDNLGVPAANLEVIPNPVDLDRVERGAALDLDWAPSDPFFLGVGRLAHVKGFDLLVRAVAELNRSHGPISLVLLGNGEERASLQSLAHELGYDRLRMPGFEANPWRFMRQALAVVVPSRLEGFSNVTVEAMACGAPVIVTDCPHGPREIVSEGKHGLLVPTNDVAALTRAMADVVERGELRSQLARLGLQRARDFAAPKVARRYLDFFASLC